MKIFDKKNKNVLIVIIIIVILLLLFVFKGFLGFGESLFTKTSTKTTAKGVEIELVQEPSVSAFVFASDSEKDGGIEDVHVRFTSQMNLSLLSEDYSVIPTSVEIVNAGFTTKPKVGRSLRLYPTTLSREETCLGNYYEGCENPLDVKDVTDMGAKGVFTISETPEMLSELPEYLGLFDFSIYLFEIGSYDHDAIMDRDGVFSGLKYLEYAGVNLSDLDSVIEFDVVIKLSDDTQVSKHFTATVDGNTLQDMFADFELVSK